MIEFSPKQMFSILESTAKINIWEGSVRSGKTFASLWRFLEELRFGPEGQYAVICKTYDAFKKNLFPLLDQFIGMAAKHYSGKRELVIFGKTIHIIGADDERAESKVRGPTFSGAYVDEATIIPESVFRMLLSRCMMGGAKVFATTNPDSPFHWLKVSFLEGNPDVKSWQFRFEDNPKLTEEEKDYIKRQNKGLWYKRFIEGLWVQAEGAIFDMFDEKTHVIMHGPHDPEYFIVGIDYGTTNPCAFVMLGVKKSGFPNMWVDDEYYYDSRVKQRQKTDSEYAEDLKRFVQGRNVRAMYIDPSAASFKMELQRAGFSNVRDADHEVIDGIRFISSLLSDGTLKIASRCKNLINEMHSYVWDSKAALRGEERPLKQLDHANDALRYACMTHFYNRSAQSLDWNKIREEARGGHPNLPPFFRDGGLRGSF